MFDNSFLQSDSSLRGIFFPISVSVAHYAAFICNKSPTKCEAYLAESIFQTCSRIKLKYKKGIGLPKKFFGNWT